MKRILALVLIACSLFALPTTTLAKSRGNEPLHLVDLNRISDPNFARNNYFKARWIQVQANIAGPATVELYVILSSSGQTVYNRTTENVEGVYTSPEIYLEYRGSETIAYQIELYVNDELRYTAIIHRMLLELNGNTFTTRGIRFREYDSGITDEWMMFTPIDFSTISSNGRQTVDLIGSNMYVVGKLTILRNGNSFMFTMQDIDEYNATHAEHERSYDAEWSAREDAPVIDDHNIRFSGVRIALYPSMSAIESVDRDSMPSGYALDTWYDISTNLFSNMKQILYLNGRISYDPNGLERIGDNINSANTKVLLDLLDTFPIGTPK